MQKTVIIGVAGAGKTYLLIEGVIKLLGDKILILTSSPRMADSIRFKLNEATVHTVRSMCEEVLRSSHP